MDISSLQLSEKPQQLKIKHPVTKKLTDIVVFCISPEHPEYKSVMLESIREGFQDADGKPDIKKMQETKKETVARMIRGWENISIDGKAFKYSEKNAIELVNKFPWIMDQVDSFCGERANFFENPKNA